MIWRWRDTLAHRLGWAPRWLCDRHEARLLRSLAAGEVQWDGVTAPTEWVVGQPADSGWNAGVPMTRIYRCDHATISGTGLVGAPTVSCGCEMAEV